MNRNRWIAIAAAGVLLLGGYAFGRKAAPENTNAAVESKALTASPSPTAEAQPNALEASAGDNKFYGIDYDAGFKAGRDAALSGATALVSTERPAYNEGYKVGLQEGIKEKNSPKSTTVVRRYSSGGRTVVYRNAGTTTARKKNSTLKTVLQIAAPAAIGAGIGAAAGGGKGAAAGAAIGGGAGAIYTIIKNKN